MTYQNRFDLLRGPLEVKTHVCVARTGHGMKEAGACVRCKRWRSALTTLRVGPSPGQESERFPVEQRHFRLR